MGGKRTEGRWPKASLRSERAGEIVHPRLSVSAVSSWQLSFESCQALIARLKAAGGQAEMLAPADRGIRGNSHMIMQDKNNLQIADLILQWIDGRVSKRPAGKK